MTRRFVSLALAVMVALAPAARAQDGTQPYFRFNFGTVPKAVGVPEANTNTDAVTGLSIQVPCTTCTGRNGAYISFEPLVFNVPENNFVTWFVASGRLPAGLDINTQTGVVYGTAAYTDPVTFTLGVVDNRQIPAYSVPVTFKALDAVGVAYESGSGKVLRSADIPPKSSNVFGAPVYTLVEGKLPAGMQLDRNTGRITGQVTSASIGNRVKLSDTDGGFAVSAPFDILTDAPEVIYPPSPYQVRTDVAVITKPTILNMVEPYQAKVASGTLPPGLRVEAATANVIGSPTQPGTWPAITVTVTDAMGTSKTSAPFTYVVSKPSVSYQSGSTRVGRFYQAAPTVAALYSPRFYLTAGSLPAGVTLDEATGVIQGNPQAAGTFGGLAVTAVDGSGGNAVSPPFTVTVADMASATATSISGRVNQALSMQGRTTNFPGAPYWTLSGPPLPAGMSIDRASGVVAGKVASPFSADGYVLGAASGDVSAQTNGFSINVVSPLAATGVLLQLRPGMTKSGTVTVTNALGAPPDLTMTPQSALPSWVGVSGFTITATAPDANPAQPVYTSLPMTVRDVDGATTTVYSGVNVTPALTLTQQPPAEALFQTGSYIEVTLATVSNAVGTVTRELLKDGVPAPDALSACPGVNWDTPWAYKLSGRALATCLVPNLSLRLTDADGSSVTTRTFTLVAEDPLTVSQPATLRIPVNVPADAPVRVYGGKGPFTFSLTSGTPPPGLPFNTVSGSFKGTPTTIGTYSGLAVRVRDARGRVASTVAGFTFTVAQELVIANPTPVGAMDADTVDSKYLAVTGGTPPYTYKVVQGSIQPPFYLSNNIIQSVKAPVGTASRGIVVEVADSLGQTDRTDPFDLTVVPPLAVPTSTDRPYGPLGQDFRMAFTTSGGVGPYTYSWHSYYAAGAASAGFSISPDGVITARSDTAKQAKVVVRVADARGRTAETPLFTLSLADELATGAWPKWIPMILDRRSGYSWMPAVTGGATPLMWTLAPGYKAPNNVTLGNGYVGYPDTGGTTFKGSFIVKDAVGRTFQTPEVEFVAAYPLTHVWPGQSRSYPTGKGGGLSAGGIQTVYEVARYRLQTFSRDKNTQVQVGVNYGRPPYTYKIENIDVPADIIKSIDNVNGTVTMMPRSVWTGSRNAGTMRMTVTDTSGQSVTTVGGIWHEAAPQITTCENFYQLYSESLNSCGFKLILSPTGGSGNPVEGKYTSANIAWSWTYSQGPPGIGVYDAGRDNGSGTLCGATPFSSNGAWHMQVQGMDVNGAKTQSCYVHLQIVKTP